MRRLISWMMIFVLGLLPAIARQVPQNPPNPNDILPVSLILDNADIYTVIPTIAGLLNLNYIIDPAVKGTVNINATGNMRRSDLMPILETILKINGATLVQDGLIYQIVPAGLAARQPLPVQQGVSPVSDDDRMTLQIVRMKFVSAQDMSALLNPFLGEGASITVQAAGNILLIADRRSNLRKLLEIIDIFDVNVFSDQRVRLFPVQNNLARDLVGDLNALSQNSAGIKFVAIERLNSILVIASNSAVFADVETWLNRLDQNPARAGIRSFVYRVKNGRVTDIQNVLAQLYGGQVQFSTIYNQPSGNAVQQPTLPSSNPAAVPTGATASQSAQSPLAPVRGEEIRIVADIPNNQLVILTTPQMYQEIERTLQELDILPRQVLIDAQIYEVVLNDSLSFGLSAILQNRGTLANAQTTGSFVGVNGPSTLNAQTFAVVGRARELVAFLNASENRSRVKTLSAPSVMVSDNIEANFQVGAEIPVPTSSSVTPVQAGGTNLFAQTIEFRPTGVLLKVKPRTNDSGNVTLEIAQEVSAATPNTTSGVVAPVIGKSSVTSTIVVQDGQTIVLGGFIRENTEFARSGVPLLSRVPGLGWLFGNTQKSTTRTELIVLITPHVLRTHENASAATDEMKAKLRELQDLFK